MVQSELSAYSGSDPIWGFVALVGSESFTGEAAVGLDPRVRLFAVEGRIYFAEREDDAAVGTRLVNCGAITANQLARGAVHAGGHESLARLFQRDATINRDAVELTIEAATESLLASIAPNPVGMPEVFPLRHHSAGLHHWLRGTTPGVPAEDLPANDLPANDLPANDLPANDLPANEVATVPPIVELPVGELVVLPELIAPELAVAGPVTPVPAHSSTIPRLRTSFVTGQPNVPNVQLDIHPGVVHSAEGFPAPELPEPATPEWPRVDDEPMWAVPADARELTALVSPPSFAETPPADLSPASITAAELPQLAALSSIQIPPVATSLFQPAQPAATDPPLPKLAAGPVSVKDLKKDLTNAAAAAEPWTSSSKNMAAVQIWEMVDVMFDDGKKQDPRVGSSAPEVRTRGWLRKKG